jgi:tetratricopeptide (TPR) repeat protein
MKSTISLCGVGVLMLVLALAPTAAKAVGDSRPEAPQASTDPGYDAAVNAVKAKQYTVAIGLLEKVVAADPNNANAFNYLGYSYRQLSDFQGSLRHYTKALSINPSHRGANEYLGELYLKMGDLKKAEERLEKLNSLCFFGCEEFDLLKRSVDAYRLGKSGASIY